MSEEQPTATDQQTPDGTDGTVGVAADATDATDAAPDDGGQKIMIIGPDGQPIGTVSASALAAQGAAHDQDTDEDDDERALSDLVEQPAKVMRIGSMIRQLLEEVKAAPLDEASRLRLKEIHRSSIAELEQGLAPELVEELQRLSLPFADDTTPSESELRIAQAQLVGWLEGLFHGIQTAIYAQQMAARAQFEQIRKALPPGAAMPPGMGAPGQPGNDGSGQPGDDHHGSGGMYL
ncbi:hypothetical protein BH09ACT12_BH09ACT12_13650 [soil metagenome]